MIRVHSDRLGVGYKAKMIRLVVDSVVVLTIDKDVVRVLVRGSVVFDTCQKLRLVLNQIVSVFKQLVVTLHQFVGVFHHPLNRVQLPMKVNIVPFLGGFEIPDSLSMEQMMNLRVEITFKGPESPFVDETGGSRGSDSIDHVVLNQRTVLLEIMETIEVGVILGFPGDGNIGIGLDDLAIKVPQVDSHWESFFGGGHGV